MLFYKNDLLLYQRKCKIKDTNLGRALIGFPEDYCVIDLETTGLNPREELIIEFAALKVRNNKVVDSFASLCDPGFSIPPLISEITHITDDMVKSSPNPSRVLPSFLEFVGDDFIIGHNVLFDCRFVAACNGEFNNDFIDTMAIFRKLHPELSHHKLLNMVEFYGKVNKSAHRALSDCEATNDCYQAMKDEVKKRFNSSESFLKSL